MVFYRALDVLDKAIRQKIDYYGNGSEVILPDKYKDLHSVVNYERSDDFVPKIGNQLNVVRRLNQFISEKFSNPTYTIYAVTDAVAGKGNNHTFTTNYAWIYDTGRNGPLTDQDPKGKGKLVRISLKDYYKLLGVP
jgi:hypothetical protein